MRIHLFEFEDFSWFPDTIRQGGTDYLRYFLNAVSFYKPVIPLISETLQQTKETQILDLCSGGGGPMEQVYKELKAQTGKKIPVTLSDKFPNTNAYAYIQEKSGNEIGFKDFSVDATDVPKDVQGLRTMFSAVHHFSPGTIRSILKNSVDNNKAIALFDGGDKNIFTILGIILFHPIAFFICTPFFRPFKFSRLFFTYIIPLIPITTVWDGCVSILRLYTPQELESYANEVSKPGYTWKSGKVKNKVGMHITYLIGYPSVTTKA